MHLTPAIARKELRFAIAWHDSVLVTAHGTYAHTYMHTARSMGNSNMRLTFSHLLIAYSSRVRSNCAHLRVAVDGGGRAVRGPACMCDASVAVKHALQIHTAVGQLRIRLRHQRLHLARRLEHQRHRRCTASAAQGRGPQWGNLWAPQAQTDPARLLSMKTLWALLKRPSPRRAWATAAQRD